MSSSLGSNVSRAVSTEFISGIELVNVDAGHCGHSQTQIARCNVLVVQLAVFVTELLKPPGRTIRYVLNSHGLTGGNMTIYSHMYRQSIDLMPTPLALRKFDEDMAYIHTLPAYSIEYGIFGNIDGVNAKRSAPSPLHFLFAPFTPTVWPLIACSVTFVFVMDSVFIRKLPIRFNGLGMKMSLFGLSSVALIGMFYNTELKTLAIAPSDLLDLANSIRHGERVIIVELNGSVRWNLLTEPKTYRSESLEALYVAVRERGIDKALLLEPNISKVCRLLETSPTHVFFGTEEKLVGICQLNGLSKYFSIAYPLHMHVGVASTSPARKYANTLLHAYYSYRSIALARMIGQIRMPEAKTEPAPLIGAECVGAGGIVIGVGWTAGLVVLGIELLWKWRKDVRRYRVSM